MGRGTPRGQSHWGKGLSATSRWIVTESRWFATKKQALVPFLFEKKKKVKLESFVFLETWLFPLAEMCTLIRFMTLSVAACPQHPWSQLCPLCCIQHGAGLASLASPLRALSQTRPLLPFHLSRERAVLFLLLLWRLHITYYLDL